ncbi:DNA cytosine methyltransferase [Bosea thiooxidans]
MIRYLSICSGIEAWTVASEGLGYQAVAFSEIDKFASAVLAERFGSNMPGEPLSGNAPPNVGDFTQLITDLDLRGSLGPIDLLVGGTPCQAFSFAGKRLSLEDSRGNLTLAYAVLAHELVRSHGLRGAVWENVPGVLSTPDNAFGCFLAAIVGADAPLDLPKGIGRWPDEGMVEGPRARAAWRVLDAQYFGLAQRRERVLLVVDFGNGPDPAAVLFEPKGLRGNSPPRREAGQKPAPTVAGGARSRGGYSHDDVPLVGEAYGGGNRSGAIDVAATLTAKGQRIDFEVETFVTEVTGTLTASLGRRSGTPNDDNPADYLIAHTLRGEGFDASEDGTGRGTPIVPVSLRGHSDYGDGLPCLRAEGGDAGGGSEALIAFDARQSDVLIYGDMTGPLDTDGRSIAIAFSCKDHGADAGEDIAPTLRAMGHGESHPNAGGQVAVAFSIMPQNSGRDYKAREVEVAQPLMAGGPVGGNQGGDYVLQPVAFQQSDSGRRLSDTHATLDANNGSRRHNGALDGWAVRRLTPTECARLQGFPDHHSRIPWRGKPAELCPDGPQYKTYGNSMATKKMRWLAARLALELAAGRA